jgi:hypothetical protein
MIRGLYHDNYCGFAGEPPPTAKPDFPLGTLTFSDEKSAFLATQRADGSSLDEFPEIRPKDLKILTILKYNATCHADTLFGWRSFLVLKKAYDDTFPDHPFVDNVTYRCVADTMVAITLESSPEMQERIGYALSRALLRMPDTDSLSGLVN